MHWSEARERSSSFADVANTRPVIARRSELRILIGSPREELFSSTAMDRAAPSCTRRINGRLRGRSSGRRGD